jgi:hypothetical protein
MSRYNYKTQPSQISASKSATKFDGTLSTKNWVEFVLNLRINEAVNFGLAYETIKYESKTRYWFQPLPDMSSEEYTSWKNSLDGEIHKKQITNMMDQCGKYDEACNKACETLLSSKYMTNDVRTMVVEHPLFDKVLQNTDPTEEEMSMLME